MQKINPQAIVSHLRNGRHENPHSGHESNLADDQDIGKFWAYFANVFGPTWREYGDTPNPVWLAELQQLSKEELQRGIEVVMELAPEFPPNLAQFLSYCRKGKPHDPINGVVRSSFSIGMPKNYQRPALPPGKVKSVAECRKELKEFCK